MHQFRPLPQYQQFEDMTEGHPLNEHVVPPALDTRSAPPITTSPALLLTEQFPVITPEQFAAFNSGQYPIVTTDQLAAFTRNATAPSLIEALQSTMSPDTTGRLFLIPAERRRDQKTEELALPRRRSSRRLRHIITLTALLGILLTTLLYLSPLNSGAQQNTPLFSRFTQWIQSLPTSFQAQSHPQPVAQHPGPVSPQPPPMDLPKSQYIAIARQDAVDAGISPDYFVRQINLESGFNPNAVSPAGAVGIAQFLPSTAAGLGVNPYDPISALRGAARLMASYAKQYNGDYAKALAAYNAGGGSVQYAVNNCGGNWLNCIPGETRNYIHVIMGI